MIATGSAVEYGYYIYNASVTNGAQYNTIKNCKITLNRSNTSSRAIYQNVATTPTNATGANSYNKFQNVVVENSYQGIYVVGNATYPDLGIEVSNCTIGAATANDIANGSSTTNGIRMTSVKDVNVFNNLVRNVTVTGAVVAYGIYLESLQGVNNLYNNNVYNIGTTSTSTSSIMYGIRTDINSTHSCNVYNNFVSGLQHGMTSASSTQVIRGIAVGVSGSGTGNFYFNSVRIDEDQFPSSTAFYIGTLGTVNAKNNIFANFSTPGATSLRYCVFKASGSTLGAVDYNNYFINTAGTGNNVGSFNTTNQNTLANWISASGKDNNSKNVNPVFTSLTDLHSASSDLNGAGVTVATPTDALTITTDIDGDLRGTPPDIGADEFTLSTKTLGIIAYNQASTANVNVGSNNNAIVRLDFPVTGNTGTLYLNSITVSSLNTSDADIPAGGVKLYQTSTNVFSTANLLGSALSFSGGTATFSSLNYDLPGAATTYIWVAYDVQAGAGVGNTVDAYIAANAIDVGGSTYPASDQSPAGSRTIADDKRISSITVTQASTATAYKGSVNNETLLLNFNVAGSTSTLPLNSIAVTYNGTSASDIVASGVKLFRTASPIFDTTNQLGSAQSLSGGIATFSGLAYDLPAGNTYLWVTFDVAAGATTNNKVDARIAANAINVSGSTFNSVEDNPAGDRNIFYQTYALPFTEMFSGSTSSLPINWSFIGSGFTQSTTTPFHGNNNTHGIYKNIWSSATTANAITPLMGPITASSQLDFEYRIVDYDLYPSVATTLALLGTGTVKAQVSTNGVDFTDVIVINNTNHVVSTSFATMSVSLAAYNGANVYIRFIANWGSTGDYYVDIDNVSVYTPANMAYVSSTSTQTVTTNVIAGAVNQQVIGIQVVTSGSLIPLDVTKFTVNANGTTSTSDISNAKIWYTGTSSSYATTTQFGSTIAVPTTDNFEISGTQALMQGTNYFWLSYDIPSSAVSGNVVDAECTGVEVGGSAYVPTVTAPAGTRLIKAPLSGTYTVGSGGNYGSFTKTDGLFADINSLGLSGNVTVNVISDITDETGATALNQWLEVGAGGYTLTIQPVNATERVISSTAAANLFVLNGADRVNIDGRYSGSGRYLRIRNTNSTYATLRYTNSAQNNTIRYCMIEGANTSTTSGVIDFLATGNNNSNLIDNCIIRDRSDASGRPVNSLYFAGTANAFGNSITNNEISNFTTAGIYLSGATSTTITGNKIFMTAASTATTVYGIYIASAPGTVISANRIYDLNGSSSASIKGIYYYGASGLTMGVDIVNNFIYLSPVTTGNVDGIDYFAWSTNSCNVYYNSIRIGGSHTSGTSATYAFRKRDAATNMNVKNNVFMNARSNSGSTAKHYAIAVTNIVATAFDLDNNNYFTSGTGGVLGIWSSTDAVTLEAWKTASTRDAASVFGDPAFVSESDLHIRTDVESAVAGKGVQIAGISTDIDGDIRAKEAGYLGNGKNPDIGADEGDFLNEALADVVIGPDGGATGATIVPGGPIPGALLGPDLGIPAVLYTITSSGVRDVVVNRPANFGSIDWYCWLMVGNNLFAGPNPIPSTTPSYTFMGIDFDAKGDVVVILNDNQTLPVELSSFTATLTADMFVRIAWVAASETNHMGYNILRGESTVVNSAVKINNGIIDQGTALGSQISYNYADAEVEAGYTYYYWLESVDLGGMSTLHGPISVLVTGNPDDPGSPELPTVTKLMNAFPNPFNPSTTLRYSLKEAGKVRIEIYNMKGQMVRSYNTEHATPGYYQVSWDGKDAMGRPVSSGVYMYRMSSGRYHSTKKMVLAK